MNQNNELENFYNNSYDLGKENEYNEEKNILRLKKIAKLTKILITFFIIWLSLGLVGLLFSFNKYAFTLSIVLLSFSNISLVILLIFNFICAVTILKGDFNPKKIKLDQKIIWGLLTLFGLMFGFIFSLIFLNVAKTKNSF